MSLRIKDSTGFFSRRQRCFILLLVVSALKSLSWQRNRDAANIFLVLPQLQIIEWNWPMQHTYMCAFVIGLYLQSVEILSNTYLLLFIYLFYFENTFNSYFFLYENLPNRKHTESFWTLFFFLFSVVMEFLRACQVICTWNSRLDGCSFLQSFHP